MFNKEDITLAALIGALLFLLVVIGWDKPIDDGLYYCEQVALWEAHGAYSHAERPGHPDYDGRCE